jgi:glycosyltransferase involved in cell wall biosynthesis
MPLMPKEVSHGMLQAYMPDFCDAVDLVISPSNGMKKILRQYGVQSHIEVVPNGVDLHRFHVAQPLSRADFGFTDQDILLIYAGRIAPEKNLEFLLQAFAGVSQVFPNVHLLIVGGGQKLFEEVLWQIPSQLGISDRVHFTGMIPNDRLPAYLAMCDAFVTASVTEVHPFTVIEAMGAGLPILGIDSPGVGDSITDRETGLLATNDLAAFTAKMTYLCMDSALRRQMGHAAREASAQYDLSRTTKIMLGHYMRLCQSTKPLKKSFDERLIAVLEEFLK